MAIVNAATGKSYITGAMGQLGAPSAQPAYSSNLSGLSNMVGSMMGQDTMSFDENGRYGITEQDERRAKFGAVSSILSGAAASILSMNPEHISRASANVGEEYRKSLDEASARHVTNRTMQYNEVRTRLEMVNGLSNAKKDELAVKAMEQKAKDDEEIRRISAQWANNTIKELEEDIDSEIAAGTFDPNKKDAAMAKAKLVAAMLRVGQGEQAQELMGQLYSADLPTATAQRMAARMNIENLSREIFEQQNPDRVLLPNGTSVDRAEYEEGKKRAGKMADADLAYKKNLAAYTDRRGTGTTGRTGPTEGELTDIRKAGDAARNLVAVWGNLNSSGTMDRRSQKEAFDKAAAEIYKFATVTDQAELVGILNVLKADNELDALPSLLEGVRARIPNAMKAWEVARAKAREKATITPETGPASRMPGRVRSGSGGGGGF